MDLEKINLRKCIIKSKSSDFKTLTVIDYHDKSEEIVFLSGKQRMCIIDFKINSIVYISEDINNDWRLITEENFKRNDFLEGLRSKLNEFPL